jgi:CheY-like chemotaxis protein
MNSAEHRKNAAANSFIAPLKRCHKQDVKTELEKRVAMNIVRPTSGRNSTHPSITIVASDNVLAVDLSRSLNTEGYVVENVDRGDEAVRKLADAPPDLVIVEWMLPGMSGPEICTRLRSEDATRALPIIMLSSRGEESLRARGFSAGADDFARRRRSRPARRCLTPKPSPPAITNTAYFTVDYNDVARRDNRVARARKSSFSVPQPRSRNQRNPVAPALHDCVPEPGVEQFDMISDDDLHVGKLGTIPVQ